MGTRRVETAVGVELDVQEAGSRGDPVVVLLHGFPESAHSWRHQMQPLADAGYHVLAPDQRGYAGSSAPDEIAEYSAVQLTADVCALLDDVGAEQAAIVGHDWGAIVAWHMGMLHPARCRAVVGASVPWVEWPAPPIEVWKMVHADRFFYILYFQDPGVAEAELDADPERFLRAIYWVASGEASAELMRSDLPAADTGLIRSLEHALGRVPDDLPSWLSEPDFDVFVRQFRASGFFGPVSWYRHFDTNYFLTRNLSPEVFTMPTAFVAGAQDPVIREIGHVVDAMADTLPDHRSSLLIPDAGHWVQQEAPEEFNRWLLDVLRDV